MLYKQESYEELWKARFHSVQIIKQTTPWFNISYYYLQ